MDVYRIYVVPMKTHHPPPLDLDLEQGKPNKHVEVSKSYSFGRRGSYTKEDAAVARSAEEGPGSARSARSAREQMDAEDAEMDMLASPVHSSIVYSESQADLPYVQPTNWREDLPQSLREQGYPDDVKYRKYDLFGILLLAFQWHSAVIIAGLISCLIHWYFQMWELELVDPLVFKSIFLVFGFCLGFRNVRANSRMEEGNRCLHNFLGTVWNIILLFPNSRRRKVSKTLLQAMRETSSYLHNISVRKHWWAAMIDVRPRHQTVDMAGCSSRPLLMAALAMVEETVYTLEPSRENSYTIRRSFWVLKMKLLHCYDELVEMTFPAVTDRYAGLLDACLFIFAILLPFGLGGTASQAHKLHGNTTVIIPGGLVTLVNCSVVLIVMTGLNALAQENEDPFGRDEEDVRVDAYLRLFEHALSLYEETRSNVEVLLESDADALERAGASKAEVEVWRHACVCNDLLAHSDPGELETLSLKHAEAVKKYLLLGVNEAPEQRRALAPPAAYGSVGTTPALVETSKKLKTTPITGTKEDI